MTEKPAASTMPPPSETRMKAAPAPDFASMRSCLQELGTEAQHWANLADGSPKAADTVARLTGEAFFWLDGVEKAWRSEAPRRDAPAAAPAPENTIDVFAVSLRHQRDIRSFQHHIRGLLDDMLWEFQEHAGCRREDVEHERSRGEITAVGADRLHRVRESFQAMFVDALEHMRATELETDDWLEAFRTLQRPLSEVTS